MQDITLYLVELSDKLDKKNKIICANAIDNLIKSSSLQKVAQYVGVIGYVLKQERAMSNCIRHKRVESKQSMQEVVMDCLKEYQDGQDYRDNDWTSKYASNIKSNPSLFKNAHVDIINEIQDSNSISLHAENIKKVASLLHQYGEQDSFINQILSHYQVMNEMTNNGLKKNFKLAQHFDPKSGKWTRSWWNRLRQPNQKSWTNRFNPFYYNEENRERGSDADVIVGIKNVLLNLTSVSQLVQNIKTKIYRVKQEAQHYTTQTHENMFDKTPSSGNYLPGTQKSEVGLKENTNTVGQIAEYINKLDPTNWNSSVAAIQQLYYLLSNNDSGLKNTRNKDIVDRTYKLIENIDENVKNVYSKIESVQELMKEIPTHNAILGRDIKFKDNDETNPRALKSPINEFLDMQYKLEKLYENPFDSQNLITVQRSVGKLWDKLRYIENPDDPNQTPQGLNQELNQNAEPNNPANPSESTSSPVNEEQIGQWAEKFNTDISNVNSLQDLIEPLNTLQQIAVLYGNDTLRVGIENIRYKIENMKDNTLNSENITSDDEATPGI